MVKQHFRKFLGLVIDNYQGQVAIFVALIFQIVFILFALMINVGLLIHHKINLQQSADLAAYYGAMKQAEMLNVISHVNFQIRQAYKLLTWRYRVLGTFGMQPSTNPAPAAQDVIQFPITHPTPPATSPFVYNPASETSVCTIDGAQISPLEIPYMCMTHYGFKEYPSQGNNSETFCKTDCSKYRGGGFSIPRLESASNQPTGGYDNSIIGSINQAIQAANTNLDKACDNSGPISTVQLAKFYSSYLQEVKNRMMFIKMMMANMSTGETEMLDIEGNKVLDGTKNTFINNLTEANNSSLNKDENIFETYNSLSNARNSECGYSNLNSSPSDAGSATLFAEINFRFIQYFLLKCARPTGTRTFSAGTIYNTSGTDLDATLRAQIEALPGGAAIANNIRNIMTQNFYNHTVGIEKNPWCSVYYGVKASSTPIIPFLPISKIRLHASAFAKPFGGSVGPRQYKAWPSTSKRSDPTGGETTQTDLNLPIQNPVPSDLQTLKDNKKILLNYSLFIGDRQGLSNTQVVAGYYDMLLNRYVTTGQGITNSSNKDQNQNPGQDIAVPTNWPSYEEWSGLTEDMSSSKYDPLAYNMVLNKNSFMRDIELSVVAPNQFETTYYSIEPDFYNVYVKDKLGKPGVLDKLKERAGLNSGTKLYIPKDFGDNERISGTGAPDNKFSVRNQLEIVQHIMRAAGQSQTPTQTVYGFTGPHHSRNINLTSRMYFTYVPYLPGSLLTSWTMKDLVTDDFSVIEQDEDATKTPFAKCLDEDLQGGNGYGSIADTADPRGGTDKLPPAPGNCITGGRSGYSVKIVSPAGLATETVNGETGAILNPPNGFVAF